MPRRLARPLCAAAGLLLLVRVVSGEDGRFPSHDVRIQIALADGGRAAVTEEYALTGPIGRTAFQFLSAPCAEVGPVSASADGRRVALARDATTREPWTVLHASTAEIGGLWRVDYPVTTRGSEAAVPIVMPAATLESADGARGARVNIEVRWSGASGAARVAMPRFEALSPDVWHATLLALPSSVRVDIRSRTLERCDQDRPGSTGGLRWRAAVFVGTMAVWVPVYLLWFGRRWPPLS